MEGTRKGRVNEESTSLGEALSARHAAQFVFMRCGKAGFTEEVSDGGETEPLWTRR